VRPWAPNLLLFLVLALPAAAGAALLADRLEQPGREQRAKEFQGLVGGLGFGPAADLSRCAFSFDPRLCPGCPHGQGPVPGGAYFCPEHACSILYYPPLDPDAQGVPTLHAPHP
jgi:hypothetical protein